MTDKQHLLLISGLIILAEAFSFLGNFFPAVNYAVFFAVSILALVFSLRDLKYGLYLIFGELFIASFGYLFYFEFDGLKISLRQSLWLIVMSVWLAGTLMERFRSKKLDLSYLKSGYGKYFLALAVLVLLGLANGLVRGNAPANVFFDFNQWLFFLLIFPVFKVFSSAASRKILKQLFLASIAWLAIKTLLLFYLFSHDFGVFALNVYDWVRQSGVGEITRVQGGFYRVFLQSQIFILLGGFLIIFHLFNEADNPADKKFITSNFSCFLLLSSCFSAVLISFSRSFWLGLAAGGIFVCLALLFRQKMQWKQFLLFNAKILLAAVFALALALAALKFPYPAPLGGFDAASLLSRRLSQLSEAGASSRWQLLPPLWREIIRAPVLGRGFGATVTYKTSDPRVLALSPDGLYTTYAFEWGWLDLWLKLGLFGLLAYLALFIKLIYDGLKINSSLSLGLSAGLVVLTAVHVSSPYANHPLGMGFLLLAAALMAQAR